MGRDGTAQLNTAQDRVGEDRMREQLEEYGASTHVAEIYSPHA